MRRPKNFGNIEPIRLYHSVSRHRSIDEILSSTCRKPKLKGLVERGERTLSFFGTGRLRLQQFNLVRFELYAVQLRSFCIRIHMVATTVFDFPPIIHFLVLLLSD